jgi:hypothetical protein
VARGVRGIGTSAEHSSRQAGLLGRTTSTLLKPFHHLRDEAFGMAKGMAAAGLAFGSFEGIKRSIETTDTLVKNTVKLRTQFGLTTQSASGLAAVLQARDLQPQGLTMGLTALAKQLEQSAHGSKDAQGAFRHFGLTTRDTRDALHSKEGLASTFDTVVDGLTKMHGGATKAALAQQLLGRASRGLAPLLQEGALGLRQQLKWAREFGVTLDEHTVGSVEDMAAAQTEAQYAMLGLQIQIGRFAAPLVTKANIALADIVRSFREGHPEGGKFARTVYQLGTDLKPVGHDLSVVGGYLKDHPRLLQAAAVAYGAYRFKLLGLLTMAPKAFAKGLLAGRAYSLGFQAGAAPGVIAAEGEAVLAGQERTHLRAHRGESVHHRAAYYGRHPAMLDRATLDALGRHTSYGPDTGGGHFHIYIDGKQVAHVMADRHGRVIAQGVTKHANDAAARKRG